MENSFEKFIDSMKIPKKVFGLMKTSMFKWGTTSVDNQRIDIASIE